MTSAPSDVLVNISFILDPDFSNHEKVLYVILKSLIESGMDVSNEDLSALMGVDRRTIRRYLVGLIDRGYVSRQKISGKPNSYSIIR